MSRSRMNIILIINTKGPFDDLNNKGREEHPFYFCPTKFTEKEKD